MSVQVAALYVIADGPYFGLEGVDPWDEERDARVYAGPHPVIAHPPCKRWGRYWSGGPNARVKRRMGDDGGCFESALAAARQWGGVIEHPEASHAWRVFGLGRPSRAGGWIPTPCGGWTCCVYQGKYGHAAPKATWIVVYGLTQEELPELRWGPCRGQRIDPGYHSAEEAKAARAARRAAGIAPEKRLSAFERLATPPEFRDLLISIARRCRPYSVSSKPVPPLSASTETSHE